MPVELKYQYESTSAKKALETGSCNMGIRDRTWLAISLRNTTHS